jgi:hypothetical protein
MVAWQADCIGTKFELAHLALEGSGADRRCQGNTPILPDPGRAGVWHGKVAVVFRSRCLPSHRGNPRECARSLSAARPHPETPYAIAWGVSAETLEYIFPGPGLGSRGGTAAVAELPRQG